MSSHFQKESQSRDIVKSSVVAAGPGAAEAAIAMKASDAGVHKQPSVGVSTSFRSYRYFKVRYYPMIVLIFILIAIFDNI